MRIDLILATTALLGAQLGCNSHSTSSTDEHAAPVPAIDGAAPSADPLQLIVGSAPTIPPVFGEVRPGMPAAQAAQLLGIAETKLSLFSRGGFQGLSVATDPDTSQVVSVSFVLGDTSEPDDAIYNKLNASWGPADYAHTYEHWFNPKLPLRARFERGSRRLTLEAYLSREQFLGHYEGGFAFEQEQPLLGAELSAIKKHYGEKLHEATPGHEEFAPHLHMGPKTPADRVEARSSWYLRFPPTELGLVDTEVHLLVESDKVSDFWVALDRSGGEESQTRAHQELEACLGKLRDDKIEGFPALRFANAKDVIALDAPQSVIVAVTKRKLSRKPLPIIVELEPTGDDRNDLKQAMGELAGWPRYCYERSLVTDPDLEGTIKLAFSINPTGRFKNLRTEDQEFDNPAVGKCIVSTFERVQIKGWNQKESVDVTFPLVFRASDGE